MIVLITVNQLAKRLHKHPSTIYRWVGDRRIPCVKNGHHILFIEEEIDKWILEQRVPAREEYI